MSVSRPSRRTTLLMTTTINVVRWDEPGSYMRADQKGLTSGTDVARVSSQKSYDQIWCLRFQRQRSGIARDEIERQEDKVSIIHIILRSTSWTTDTTSPPPLLPALLISKQKTTLRQKRLSYPPFSQLAKYHIESGMASSHMQGPRRRGLVKPIPEPNTRVLHTLNVIVGDSRSLWLRNSQVHIEDLIECGDALDKRVAP